MKEVEKFTWEIILGFVVIAVVLLAVFIIFPTVTAVFSTNEEIKVTREKNELLLAKIVALDKFDLTTLENNYRLVNFALLKDRKPNLVFSFFDDVLNQETKIDVSIGRIGFSPGEIKKDSNKKEKLEKDLVFDTPIKGKFDDIATLVDLSEKNYPLFSVKSLSGEMEGNADIKTNFILHVYPELSALPSVQNPIYPFSDNDKQLLDEISRKYASFTDVAPAASQKYNRTNLFE